MCLDEYATNVIVSARLEELRESAERARVVLDTGEPVRVAVGRSLIRIGRWLAAPRSAPHASAT
jgi:hypothetical protein